MAEIVVVGDNPTAMEFRKHVCMTGPAVSILKQTMEKVGLPTSTDKVYYTTAIKEVIVKKKGSTVPKETIMNARPSLLLEIKARNPKMVIVLGKTAIQTITGDMKIKVTEEYGRVRNYDFLPGIDVIPIMHPALIMRAPGDYKPFLSSLQLISTLYNGGSVHDTGETKWQILRTDAECDQALKFLTKYDRVAADMETTDLDYRVAEFCVMGMAFAKNKVLIVPREMRHRVKDFLELPNLKWIWHHGKYDRKVMWRRRLTVFDELGWHKFPHQDDTLYMHYVLDETSAHDLGYLTKTFLQAAEYKYKMNQEFKAVTLDTYEHYFDSLCERVAVDCDYSLQLADVLWAEICKPENESLKNVYENLIMPATDFLAKVEQNGMLIDPEVLYEMDIKYEALLAQIMQDIEEAASPYWDREAYMAQTGAKSASDKFKPGSPKQMSWMVFDKLKLKPRRKKGRSTDADVLKSIEDEIPLVQKVLEYRGVAKERSTYVQGILKKRDVDGRVRSNFSLHITATGRLSSKEPNVQNIPSSKGVGNVRRTFIPPKGKILVEIDYSGAELRWLAFLSHDKKLNEIFKTGRNLHKETATSIFGPDFTPVQKMRAKAVNFGIPYGRQANSFKEEFNISIEEAQAMIDGWLNAYPEARDYLQWCADQVSAGKFLQTPWGNRRRAGLVTPDSLEALENEYKNFPIQGSSSHTLLYAAMKLAPDLKRDYDTVIIDLIHDSMLLEVPMDLATVTAVSKKVSAFMIDVPKKLFGCDVPFKTDTDLGPDWGNVCAFNHNTGMMELENEHHEVTEVPYEEWIQKEYHWDIYEQEWYKNLQSF